MNLLRSLQALRIGHVTFAFRADALAAEIAALHHHIRTAKREPMRPAGFRCDAAAGSVRQAARETTSHPPSARSPTVTHPRDRACIISERTACRQFETKSALVRAGHYRQ